jgi:hypothetical protein
MELLLMFICIKMHLQTLLFHSYICDAIFILFFQIKRKLYIALGGGPPPPKYKILGALLKNVKVPYFLR